MEEKEDEKYRVVNINFFKKVWYSITKFEKYPEMATEGLGRALKYLAMMCAFITVFMTISSFIEMKKVVFNLSEYIEQNIPEFSYEDGHIQMDTEEPIIIDNIQYDGINRIIINPLLESDEEKEKFEAENDATGVTIYFFKNQIVMRTKVDNIDTKISPYTYKDFVQNYAGNDVKSFSKTQLIEYMRSSKMNNFYGKYMISSFISLLLVEIMITLIDALEIAAFGWLTTMITRIRIRFVAIYNMAVYALTLPMILNMLYIIVNYFTTFTISYFQVAYITIAYIYLAAVIFLLKDDLLKKLEEVEKIKKEQEKVVHEPTGSYGMDTITMRQKIMERVMLMEENQLKEMLRFSNELEQKSWLLPHTQEELEIAINRGMEDVKAGRIVSHEDVLKYYMK